MRQVIQCTKDDVSVSVEAGRIVSLPWTEIAEARAYRIDVPGLQSVVIELLHESGHAVDLLEDSVGWPEFVHELAAFAGANPTELAASLARLSIHDETRLLFTRSP